MPKLNKQSLVEQVAAHLRECIERGDFIGFIPGRDRLARDLGVSPASVQRGLDLLVRDGILTSPGGRRRRRILSPRSSMLTGMRITILPYDDDKTGNSALLAEVEGLVRDLGCKVSLAAKSLKQLKMDPGRVKRLVEQSEAAAWVIIAGNQEVLEWFSRQDIPCLAIFGRFRGLPIAAAGLNKSSAYRQVVRRLIELGHRKIVTIAREERRSPEPGAAERAILEELQAAGIPTGSYHLPAWGDSADELREGLDRLFAHTPPTALIVQVPKLFTAVLQHLARRGIHAPELVSLVCGDADPTFDWCWPSVAHVRWDNSFVAREIVRWVRKLARGKRDLRQILIKAEFIEGATMGRVPDRR